MSKCSRENLEAVKLLFCKLRHSPDASLKLFNEEGKYLQSMTQTEADSKNRSRDGMKIQMALGRILSSCIGIQENLPCQPKFSKDCQCFRSAVREYLYSHLIEEDKTLIDGLIRHYVKVGFPWEHKELSRARGWQMLMSTTNLVRFRRANGQDKTSNAAGRRSGT